MSKLVYFRPIWGVLPLGYSFLYYPPVGLLLRSILLHKALLVLLPGIPWSGTLVHVAHSLQVWVVALEVPNVAAMAVAVVPA